MSNTTSRRSYATQGSLALQAQERPVLRLLEGGASQASAAPYGREDLSSTHASRIFFITCVVMLAVFLVVGLARQVELDARRSAALSTVSEQSYVVQPGDSAWSLAEAHPISGLSTQDVAQFILQESNVEGSALEVGQTVVLPVN